MNLFRTAVMMTLTLFVVAGSAEEDILLQPDPAPVKVVEQAPPEGSPQATMVNFIMLREEGKIEEASKLISTSCKDWLRDAMLEQRSTKAGPLKVDSISYQLMEYAPESAKVSIQYNMGNGSYNSWQGELVREDGKWVIK